MALLSDDCRNYIYGQILKTCTIGSNTVGAICFYEWEEWEWPNPNDPTKALITLSYPVMDETVPPSSYPSVLVADTLRLRVLGIFVEKSDTQIPADDIARTLCYVNYKKLSSDSTFLNTLDNTYHVNKGQPPSPPIINEPIRLPGDLVAQGYFCEVKFQYQRDWV